MKKSWVLFGVLVLVIAAIAVIEFVNRVPVVEVIADGRAPNFQLLDLQGNERTLEEFRGKHVVLNFWASWCPPCKQEMPYFERLHVERDDIEVIGVNLQEDIEDVQQFLADVPVTYTILLDPKKEAKAKYNVITQPVTYFIDKEGIIVGKKFGLLLEEELEAQVAKFQ